MTTLFALIFWGAPLGTPEEAPKVLTIGFGTQAACEAMGADLLEHSNVPGKYRKRFSCAPIVIRNGR